MVDPASAPTPSDPLPEAQPNPLCLRCVLDPDHKGPCDRQAASPIPKAQEEGARVDEWKHWRCPDCGVDAGWRVGTKAPCKCGRPHPGTYGAFLNEAQITVVPEARVHAMEEALERADELAEEVETAHVVPVPAPVGDGTQGLPDWMLLDNSLCIVEAAERYRSARALDSSDALSRGAEE